MGAKVSRRKSDGAGAPSEQKHDDLEAEVKAETMPAEESPQMDITPRDFTTRAVVSEESGDVLNKSTETVEAKVASVGVEDPTELVAAIPDPEAKHDSLMGFSQEFSTKIEFSIPGSPAEPVSIPCEPLTSEDHSITEPPELFAEAVVGDVEALAMESKAVSGQEASKTDEMLVNFDPLVILGDVYSGPNATVNAVNELK